MKNPADLIPLQTPNTLLFVLHKPANLTTNCGEEKEKVLLYYSHKQNIYTQSFDKRIPVIGQMVLKQKISLQPRKFFSRA